MSYLEICDRFEPLAKRISYGTQWVVQLNNIFKQLKKATNQYSQKLGKISQLLESEFPAQRNLDSISIVIKAFKVDFNVQYQQFYNFVDSLQTQVIEPLDLFLDSFAVNNNENIQQAMAISKRIEKSQQQMTKQQGKYFNQQRQKDQITKNSSWKKLSRKLDNSAKTEEKYKQYFEESKKHWEHYENVIPLIMQNLQQNEESKIHFLKQTFEKYLKTRKVLHSNIVEQQSNLQVLVNNINTELDLRVQVDTIKCEQPVLIRQSFKTYEELKKEYETSPQQKLITEVLNTLLVDNQIDEINPRQYSKLTEILLTTDGRQQFCNILQLYQTRITEEAIEQLGALLNTLLTSIVLDEDDDPQVFNQIVQLCQRFYCMLESGKRRYLNHYVSGHKIWRDKERWQKVIEWFVYNKIQREKIVSESLNRKNRAQRFVGALKSFAYKLPGAVKPSVDNKADKSTAFFVISQFNFSMINLGIQLDLASEIALSCSQKLELDRERICILLAELQANQRSQKIPLQDRQLQIESLRKKNSKRAKWGDLLPFRYAIDFLTDNEILQVIQVSRQWNKLFKMNLYKRNFKTSNELDVTRKQIWMNILHSKRFPSYRVIRKTTLNNLSELEELDEIIQMDVARSFSHHTPKSQEVLRNILRSYAFYQRDIGYCQGMNYIAGTLHSVLQCEQDTFYCLAGFIADYSLDQLFSNNLSQLKLLFYQFDRLVSILIPELHDTFKEEMVNCSHYSSSWFITLFSSILQNKQDILLSIWDMFLIEGWKAIFKAGICILESLQNELIGRKFEQIMMILTIVNQFDEIFDSSFIKRVRNVSVTRSLLRDIKSEYQHLKLRAGFDD